MGFRVKVAPIATLDRDMWKVPIYLERGVGDLELFATAHAPSKEIAQMRASLIEAAINRGVGNEIQGA